MESEGADRKQSEFNMAVSWLGRLNYWFYICDEQSNQMNIYEWFQSLLILTRELITEMKPEEKQELEQTQKRIFPEINRVAMITERTGNKKVPPSLYWQLHEMETKLRTILDDSGLQKKAVDDALKALQ